MTDMTEWVEESGEHLFMRWAICKDNKVRLASRCVA